jgi:hypothetical protein
MTGGRAVGRDLVTELVEQADELVGAAVDIADEVERPVLVAPVGPPALSLDRDGIDLVGAAQDEDATEALPLEALD